jgi:hypothetical protein
VLFTSLLVSTGLLLRRTARRAAAIGDALVARIGNALIFSLVAYSISSVFLSAERARPLWIVIGLALALPKLLPAEERARLRRRRAPEPEPELTWQ